MTKKSAATPEEAIEPSEATPGAPKKREREITNAPTVGGAFTEDGDCVQEGGLPEPDEHRLKKPER